MSLDAVKRKRCLLCGRRPFVAAVFVPKDQRRVCAPAGKVRAVSYTLCKKCFRKPDSPRRAENRILGDFDALARVN